MIDMRDYKGVIREAVRQERHRDLMWTWKVRAINKGAAKIGWGYLDHLGGAKEDFVVSVEEHEDFGTVITGSAPNGHKVIWFVGPHDWDDCKTVEDGIAGVIHNMAMYAHCRY